MFEFFEIINWTLVAAVAAAISAFFAAFQICSDIKWRKMDRTFKHSPYRNPEFYEAWIEIREIVPDQSQYCSAVKTSPKFKKEHKEYKDSIIICANLWGQMATEYNNDLLNKKIAKETLKKNFNRFCGCFHYWLKDGARDGVYENTLKLYEEWNCE